MLCCAFGSAEDPFTDGPLISRGNTTQHAITGPGGRLRVDETLTVQRTPPRVGRGSVHSPSVHCYNGEGGHEDPLSGKRAVDQATLDVLMAKSCLRSQFQALSGS